MPRRTDLTAKGGYPLKSTPLYLPTFAWLAERCSRQRRLGLSAKSDFCRSRIDHQLDFRDMFAGEATLDGVGTNHLFVGSDVDTVNGVGRYIAVQPLDLRPEAIQSAARLLLNSEHLIGAHVSDAGERSLNNVLGHVSAFPVRAPDNKKWETRARRRLP